MLLLSKNIFLSHPVLLRRCLDLPPDRILQRQSFVLPLQPGIVKIYIGLLLESVRRIINIKLLNTIFDFQEHRIVLQFGIWRQALVQNLLLELNIFIYLVFISVSIQLEALELLFVMSFDGSVVITFHF